MNKFLLFILIFSQSVFSQDLDLEEIAKDISSSTNSINHSDIYHKSIPSFKVQENLGNFSTSFSIQIFKNLVNFDRVKFNYSSSSYKNSGFGVGWEVDLPRIIFKKSTPKKYEFVVLGFQYVDKLTRSESDYPEFEQRLQDLNLTQSYRVYIPRKIGNFNKYLRFDDGSWLIIKKDGSYLKLNERGLVVSISDSFNNRVQIEWEEDFPKRIFSTSSEALFEYETIDDLPYVNYNYLVNKRELRRVEVKSKGSSATYKFNIKSGYLQSVKKVGSEVAILDVEYADLVSKEEPKFEFEHNTSYVFDNSLSTPSLYKKNKNIHLFLDLQGDNYSDELYYKSSDYLRKVIEVFSKSISNSELNSSTNIDEVQSEIDTISLGKKIFLSESGLKKEYQSNFRERPFSVFVKEVNSNGRSRYRLNYSTNIMKVLDVDQDNVAELVVCSGGDKLSHSLEDSKERKNSIFEYSRTGRVDPSENSSQARVYSLQKTNGFLNFELRRDINLKCHSDSIFADINLDGSIDVINGSEVYFGDNSSGYFQKKSISLDKVVNVDDYTRVKDKKFIYSFDRATKKIRFVEGEGEFRSPLENQSVYSFNDHFKYLRLDTNTKLLSKIKNSHGGLHTVNYDYKGKWVVSSVKSSSDELVETSSYNYITPVLNNQSGLFEGFSIVDIENKKNSDYFKNKYQRLIFSNISDISSSYSWGKDELYGYLRKKVSGSYDAVQYNKGERHIVHNDWSFMNLSDDQVFIYKSKKTDSIAFDNTIVRNKSLINEYKFNEDNFLYESIETRVEGGLLGLFSHLSENSLSTVKEFSEDKSRLKTFVKKEIISDDFINIKKIIRNIYDVELGYIVEKYTNENQSESLYRDSFGRLSNVLRNNTDYYSFEYTKDTNLISSYERNDNRVKVKSDSITGQKLELVTLVGDTVEYEYDSSDRLIRVMKNNTEIINSDYLGDNKVKLRRANDIENIELDAWGRVKTSQKIEPFSLEIMESRSDKSGDEFLKVTGEQITLERYYDEFSRPVQEIDHLRNSNKEYTYSIEGRLEYLNGNLITTSDHNEGYSFNFEATFGNSVEMSYSLDNRMRRVKGNLFDTKWGYNRENAVNLSQVKGEGVEFDFIRTFSTNLSSFTLSDMALGLNSTFINNESGKFLETKCLGGACRGFYKVQNSYEDTLLKEEVIKTEGLSQNIYYEYEKSNLSKVVSKDYELSFDYDQFGKISKTSIGGLSYEREEDYLGNILSFKPYVNNVQYNNHGLVSNIIFNDKLKISFSYDGLRLIQTSMIKSGNNEYNIKVKQNDLNLITSVNRTSRNGGSKNTYHYDANSQYISALRESTFERNKKGQVVSIEERKFSYCYNLLCQADNLSFFYSENEELRIVTNKKRIVFEKINNNSFKVENDIIHSFKIGGKIVAVSITNEVYPVLSDHLGSVVAMFDQDGELLWEREYSAYGVKSLIYTSNNKARILESKTIFSFAGLIEVPGVSHLYWSKTRIYSPKVREWMTLDPAYIWEPLSLVSRRGDWNPLVYCNGDPVNFIDPSGYYSESYSLSAGDGSNDYDGATFNTQREADWATMAIDQNQINSIMEQDRLISNIGMGIIGSAVLATGAYAYGPSLYASVMTLAAQNPQAVKEGVELANQVLLKGKGKAPSSNVPDTFVNWFQTGRRFVEKVRDELK
ncbi:RHS repeat-associated core domain-containing protein [Halobacteriovorax sp. JY17]|uniref:RHS repeat domain-containing protein n=1 Tax=Halobacteriovorax sp. JY17 TaxID=2014617 RepID=UPI0025BDED23|nr:RHS repeat-associated core domain-containing protein [Halobacteriovorax sp. JY17]